MFGWLKNLSPKTKTWLLIVGGGIGTVGAAAQIVAPLLGPIGVAAFAIGGAVCLLATNLKDMGGGKAPTSEELLATAAALKEAAAAIKAAKQ